MGSNERDLAALCNPVPSFRCSLCKKTFAQESTQKRHYYYCRSKQHGPVLSRKRSCAACVRAKARCTWLTDAGQQACARCKERGAVCEYDAGSGQSRTSTQGDLGSESTGSAYETQDSSSQAGTDATSSAITRKSGPAETLSASTSSSSSSSSSSREVMLLGSSSKAHWGFDFGEISSLKLGADSARKQDPNRLPNALIQTPEVPHILNHRLSNVEPWALKLRGSAPFNARSFSQPSKHPLAALALGILQSYPFMLLGKDAFPPFISPLLHQWVKIGQIPPQQSLINCVSLIHMFKRRTEANKGFIWLFIKTEQERILNQYSQFNRWELLAASQALLIYCLLRLQDGLTDQGVFDVSLLTTVNLVSGYLFSIGECQCEHKLSDDANVTWRIWVFNESRRRTWLIYQIINLLIEIPDALSWHPSCGLAIIPLPSNKTLWNARNAGEWGAEFQLSIKQRTIYGVSWAGELTKLQETTEGVQVSVERWEEWCAEVGEIGTLIMGVGALLG